jgi:DoxX-like family
MYIIYVVITVVGALLYGYAAFLNFVGAESVKVVADRVQVSQKWMIPFGVLLASGAVGLVIGLVVPALGIAAAIGLVLYFICAMSAHIRVHDRGIGGAAAFFVLALAVLAVNIVYRTHSG